MESVPPSAACKCHAFFERNSFFWFPLNLFHYEVESGRCNELFMYWFHIGCNLSIGTFYWCTLYISVWCCAGRKAGVVENLLKYQKVQRMKEIFSSNQIQQQMSEMWYQCPDDERKTSCYIVCAVETSKRHKATTGVISEFSISLPRFME